MLHTVLLEASSNASCVLDGCRQVHQNENKCSASITFHSSYLATSHSKDTSELLFVGVVMAGNLTGGNLHVLQLLLCYQSTHCSWHC